MTLHPLEPDLAAIRRFSQLPTHDLQNEARAAMALYEDVCWRAAMVPLTRRTAAALADGDAEASTQVRRYVAGETSPEAFWSSFKGTIERLDALLGEGLEVARDARLAYEAVRGLRARLAAGALPASLRAPAEVVLNLLEAEVGALADGKLDRGDFERLVAQGTAAVEEALASYPQDGERAELLVRRAMAVELPPFLRPLVARLIRKLGEAPGDEATMRELESALQRGAGFIEAHAHALARYQALTRALDGAHVEAPEQLVAMEQLLAALDNGELPPDDFNERFEAAASQIERGIRIALDGSPARRLAIMRGRVDRARVPSFVARTARELLDVLQSQVDHGADDQRELDALFRQLDETLAFGEDLTSERAAALLRFHALERRAAATELPLLLHAPVMDQLETLRGLLHRLDLGLYPLAAFHHDFEHEATRVELLLGWQNLLAEVGHVR